MASVQLSFNLRTSSSVKTVHLLGSWDIEDVQDAASRWLCGRGLGGVVRDVVPIDDVL